MARADIADDAGFCFPSVFTLAAKVSMDQRSVQRILRKLTRRFLCVNRATIS
ncbi:MAG: helix-turn-helix domain-containing protein [Betaproteobacteria bacterium]|nr:MAG: helix-turn-helix domain-containing protein [Betaproteobacteria bacterium]